VFLNSFLGMFALLMYRNSLLALQFWQQDFYDIEKRSVLDTARSRFPIQFEGLTQMLVSLCACERSAEYVLSWFAEVETYTQAVSRFDVDVKRTSVGGMGGGGECTWLNSETGLRMRFNSFRAGPRCTEWIEPIYQGGVSRGYRIR
jgi:hypothetical protein